MRRPMTVHSLTVWMIDWVCSMCDTDELIHLTHEEHMASGSA